MILPVYHIHLVTTTTTATTLSLLAHPAPIASTALRVRFLPLLNAGPGLALVALDGVEHDLVGVVLAVGHVALAPVVADGVREDGAARVEGGRRDAAADVRVPLEPVLRVLVPEVERAVATGRAEGPVLRVERDVVDGVHLGRVALGRVAVALEGEV